MRTARIGLGTVQWGLDYGIANKSGRPGAAAISEMLHLAAGAGIDLLDTARAYGLAEQVIGEAGVAASGFRIVTKLPPLPPTYDDPAAVTRHEFAQSLTALRRSHVDTLMVHHGRTLLGDEGAAIWRAMEALKSEGRVRRLGASVYDVAELSALLDRFPIEVVQLPYNLYDQRFAATGMLDELARQNVEVHARSALLQGLLAMTPEALPAHFAPIADHHRRLHADMAVAGMTPLQGALRFCLDDRRLSRVLLGCETLAQLAEIIAAIQTTDESAPLDWGCYALADEAYILPTHWPRPTA